MRSPPRGCRRRGKKSRQQSAGAVLRRAGEGVQAAGKRPYSAATESFSPNAFAAGMTSAANRFMLATVMSWGMDAI